MAWPRFPHNSPLRLVLLASPFPGGETEAEGPSDEPGIRTRKLQSWIQTRPLASLGS